MVRERSPVSVPPKSLDLNECRDDQALDLFHIHVVSIFKYQWFVAETIELILE